MMLKANGEYLDFRGDIEIEKKIKLFEDIETADGDLSFAFDINLTSENLRILGIPIPDSTSKIVYQNIPCEVQSDQGLRINIGSLRIERIIGYTASCSFLGGNSNWFAMLDGDMTELRLSHYDIAQNEATITGSWLETSGIVFPAIDPGTLVTRSFNNFKTEDFIPCFYLHSLFKEVFQQSGIKIQGDLLEDSLYNQIVIAANGRNKAQIEARSMFAGLTGSGLGGVPVSTPFTGHLIFGNTSGQYFDTTNGNYTSSPTDYTADVAMVVSVVVTVDQSYNFPVLWEIEVNGATVFSLTSYGTGFTKNISLSAGDSLTVNTVTSFSGTIDDATLKITPLFIYYATGRASVPLWTKQQFVSNILKLFNCITSFNQATKTLTIDLFDKIKTKPAIDLSEFIQVDVIDYIDFISNYGQSTVLKYNEGNDEDLREYNISSFLKYGSGSIPVDNYYIEKSKVAIESDFSTPISYLNNAFNGSMERINFVELEEDTQRDITSVTDSGGTPRFNIANADDYFLQNDLVRIEAVPNEYDGDYVVTNVTSTYVVLRGPSFGASAVGTITKMQHTVTTDENVYLFVNIPYRPSDDIFGTPGNYLNQNLYDSLGIVFFNLLRLGKTIEDEYKQGLSFGEVDNPLSFQKTLIDKYWQQFSRILNDPVKLLTTGNLPWKVYNSLDFLAPVTIKTLETTNLYYVNRILGYKDSSVGCEVDLIKLP